MSLWLDLTRAGNRICDVSTTLDHIGTRVKTFGVSVEAEANIHVAQELLKAAHKHLQEAARLMPENAPREGIAVPMRSNPVEQAFANLKAAE